MPAETAVVDCRDLSLGYAGRPALQGLDGIVARGERLAVVGPNGAGKTTFLRALAGEIGVLSGQLRLRIPGEGTIGYLPQAADLDRSFPITAAEFAGTGLWKRLGPFARLHREERRALAEALARTGLEPLSHCLLSELSGGQLQRLLFARTLLQDPCLILLDEPFASVDAETTSDLLEILKAWHVDGRTIIASLHDLGQVRDHFPRTLLLAGRPIAWGSTTNVLTPTNLRLASGRASPFPSHDLATELTR
ncbi:metal ABC transporter ATP-binding protein [uncultured Enterovirga sp.]|uniref:metal ABC transporter ATP-binding protein n=1 Tax=uncultured Enterovirga sp. TaxID=2026352 RepID=UPI0035C95283